MITMMIIVHNDHEIAKIEKLAHTTFIPEMWSCFSFSHDKRTGGTRVTFVNEGGSQRQRLDRKHINIYVYIIKIVYKGVGRINKWKTN